MRLPILATLLAVSACSAQQITYSGDLRPVSGTCDPPARAELTRRGKAVLFLPNSGTISLTGLQNGTTITAVKTLIGADKKPYKLVFSGNLQGPTIQGTYLTTRCRYKVSLYPLGR